MMYFNIVILYKPSIQSNAVILLFFFQLHRIIINVNRITFCLFKITEHVEETG